MLRFPAQILPMMGFSSCDNSDVFQWPKLVSIGRSCSEPFSHLQQLSNKLCISDANHTLSSLSAHSDTHFSHSHTSLGLQQRNTSLIKKGHRSISSSSILIHSSSLIIFITFIYVSATFTLDA